jgi:hypothetical protein
VAAIFPNLHKPFHSCNWSNNIDKKYVQSISNNGSDWTQINRSEIFKPCNSEIAVEPPHSCIIGTILVHSFTDVSGGGNASKLEFSGGGNASTAEIWGLDFFPLHAYCNFLFDISSKNIGKIHDEVE